MFWVVDSLMMRKYKTAKGLEHSCEGGSAKKGDSLPWTNGSEESRVRILPLNKKMQNVQKKPLSN